MRVPQLLGPDRRDGSGLSFLALMGRSVVALGLVFYSSTTIATWIFPDSHHDRLTLNWIVFMTVGSAATYLAVTRPAMQADKQRRDQLEKHQAALLAQAAQHDFAAGLQDGFDMAENEHDAFDLVSRVLPQVHDGPAELLVADSSRAHLSRVAVSGADRAARSGRRRSARPSAAGTSRPSRTVMRCPAARGWPNGDRDCPRCACPW